MEKKNDFKEFTELMVSLSIATGKDVSVERAEMYFKFLQDFEIDVLEKTFHHLIKTEKFPTFPTIGKIRSLIEGEEGEMIDYEANAAWSEACKLAWEHGETGRPTGDYLLDEAIRVAFGGWKYFGETDPQFEGGDRKHFINCYKGVAKREKYELLKPANIRKQLMENRKKMDTMKPDDAPY
ncbi:MAG: hypothetical protein IMF20_00460 [Proteobacteria bacterium]|nr:hypothetical protein [Pseudomonadota bacterium]